MLGKLRLGLWTAKSNILQITKQMSESSRSLRKPRLLKGCRWPTASCLGGFITLYVFTIALSVIAADEAPTLTGVGGGVQLNHPEMFKSGWVDLNRNGRKDIYEDPTQPIEKRVENLLKRMTREERIGQLWQRPMKLASETQDAKLIMGGEVGSYLGATPDPVLRNRLQRLAVEESRLGIPLVFGYDTIHGFRTIFPIPLAQSCSWDLQLVECIQAAAAAESAASGINWTFAPMVDIARDLCWGRVAEGIR